MKLAVFDMGSQIYGDSIFIENGGVKVLVDGGHPGDYDGQPGVAPLPDQIAAQAGGLPINVDLLVVTHSHADHVGCLPKMVAKNKLRARFALVSDPDHRWGKPAAAPPDSLPAVDRAVSLLGEEIPPLDYFRSSDELRAYLDASVTLEDSYRAMLASLRNAGTTVVRHATDKIPQALKDVLKTAGLTILGPTKTHLRLCAKRLAEQSSAARDALMADPQARADSAGDYVELYTRLVRAGSLADAAWQPDAATKMAKGAINNLSIVMSLQFGGVKILLPGDMQFVAPETTGLDTIMAALLKKVVQGGPYEAIKLPHHTSYNGWDEDLDTTKLPTPLLIHSGGSGDPSHPDPDNLRMLATHVGGHTFLRTDRNGLIVIEPQDQRLRFSLASGAGNDFTPNLGRDEPVLPGAPGLVAALPAPAVSPPAPTSGGGGDVVRIHAEIPCRRTRVVITVDIDPAVPGGVSVTQVADEKKN